MARTENFQSFVRDIAMQVAAMNPSYVSREEVPQEAVEKEKEVLRAQAKQEGKPEHVIDKIVNGRLEKFYQSICLLDQSFIKDQDMTIQELLKQTIAKIGENISIRRFARFVLGEGLEKKKEDLAAEVEAQIKG